MKFRKLIRIAHRDLGYIAVALTIIYSISGIAVNHVTDWNPNYSIKKDTLLLGTQLNDSLSSKELTSKIVQILSIKDTVKNSFRETPTILNIFFNKKTLSVNLKNGVAIFEHVKSRTIFREVNFLHLNNPKKIWTWIADLFAVSLIVLALTGLFMIKGKKGFNGRGKWFVLIGLLIPLVFLLLYF